MISDENMSSAKPYLIRALHQWIIDNGMTPLVVVQGTNPLLDIPAHLTEDDTVVFNISYDAADRLDIGNEFIGFHARFSGQSYSVSLPIGLISAIYSRENGKGMMFDVDDANTDAETTVAEETTKPALAEEPKANSKSHLKLVD